MLERIILQAEKHCYAPPQKHSVLNDIYDAYFLVRAEALALRDTSCWAMALSNQNRIIGIDLFQPKQGCFPQNFYSIIKFGLISNAEKMIFLHTHNEPIPRPSKDDNIQTNCLRRSLDNVGIELVDHIIIGSQWYWSYTIPQPDSKKDIPGFPSTQ